MKASSQIYSETGSALSLAAEFFQPLVTPLRTRSSACAMGESTIAGDFLRPSPLAFRVLYLVYGLFSILKCCKSLRASRTTCSSSKLVPLFVLMIAAACIDRAQSRTTVDLSKQRNADFATFPFTRPVSVGPALPSTCLVGQLWFLTVPQNGSYLQLCTTPNTWTPFASATSAATSSPGTAQPAH